MVPVFVHEQVHGDQEFRQPLQVRIGSQRRVRPPGGTDFRTEQDRGEDQVIERAAQQVMHAGFRSRGPSTALACMASVITA
jgi:hypothetical protein